MLRSEDHRVDEQGHLRPRRRAWTADTIDPRLVGTRTRGRWTQPGLREAVEAMQLLVEAEDAERMSVNAAAQFVEQWIHYYWREHCGLAERSDTIPRLKARGLRAGLRRAYYRAEI